jgi:Tol biopolymer transport system component
MAQPFDPERGRLTGDPQPVAESLPWGFDVSQNGTLISQAGDELDEERRLTWFDRTGKELGRVGESAVYYQVRLSPDGSRLAFVLGAVSDLWVEEIGRGVRTRLTKDPETDKGNPVWSPDGSRILFGAIEGRAQLGIFGLASNGSGSQELVLPSSTSDLPIWPTSWSPDGKVILYSRGDLPSLTRAEIWALPLTGERKPHRMVQTAAAAYDGQFSPNGEWMAYTSKESGREEVYVVPFEVARDLATVKGNATGMGDKWQISSSGGAFPKWRSDNREIFYVSLGDQMMAVGVEEKGNRLEIGKAMPLFKAAMNFSLSPYDVAADGERFIINTKSQNLNTPLTLVVNLTARLGKR